MELASGRSDTEGSNKRLFHGTARAIHYTTAYPSQNRDHMEECPECGIPLHHIHVRNEIYIQN
jgi:hypothetical protein